MSHHSCILHARAFFKTVNFEFLTYLSRLSVCAFEYLSVFHVLFRPPIYCPHHYMLLYSLFCPLWPSFLHYKSQIIHLERQFPLNKFKRLCGNGGQTELLQNRAFCKQIHISPKPHKQFLKSYGIVVAHRPVGTNQRSNRPK